MNTSNVEKVFQLPLQESEAAMFRYIIQVHMQSVDLKYKPTGGCSEYENGSYTCWAQITKAIFNASIWVSQSVSVIEDIPNRLQLCSNLRRFPFC